MKFGRSIRTQLILAVSFLVILPVVLLSFTVSRQLSIVGRQQSLFAQEDMALQGAEDIAAYIAGPVNEMRLVGELQSLAVGLDQQQAVLNDLLDYDDVFHSLTLLDASGQEVLRVARAGLIADAALVERIDAEAFSHIVATREVYYSSIFFDETTGSPDLFVALPLAHLRSGEIANVLIAEIGFEGVWDLVAEAYQEHERFDHHMDRSYMYVVDGTGRLVAHPDPEVVLQETYFEMPEEDGVYPRGLEIDGDVTLVSRQLELGDQVLTVITEVPETISMALARDSRTVMLFVAVILLVFGLVFGLFVVRWIIRPIMALVVAAQAIGQGDLDQEVKLKRGDELGMLAGAFNQMARDIRGLVEAERESKSRLEHTILRYRSFAQQVSAGNLTDRLLMADYQLEQREYLPVYELGVSLNEMVDRLTEISLSTQQVANQVSAAAAEILAATTQQIASATEQEAAVTQTMTTVEEVRTTVTQTAERAQSVADAAEQSVRISVSGEDAVSDSVAGMQLIQERVTDIATTILALSERTQQIGEIINTVNEIADQSKLLALNASIEAARAGEEGRGFAVVAMEVRQLAEQSRQATARVADILNEIQQATNTAVMVTEEGSKQADSGAELVHVAGEAIRELAVTLEASAQAATQIAASTHQQTNGIDQLAGAIQSIRQATAQTAASTRQAERSAQDLNAMAEQMETVVAQYQLEASGA
jgi:methyl-accepting chemotaxis protein